MTKKSSGQTLLIVVLLMTVGLTTGLSLISRSLTDIKISRRGEESSRAFSAAEAGIEESLRSGVASSGTFTENASEYKVTKTGVGGSSAPFSLGQINHDDTQTVWLIGHDTSGGLDYAQAYSGSTIDVCWGETNPSAAIEAIVYYRDLSSKIKVWRQAFDPEARGNNFSPVDSSAGGNCGSLNLKYRKTLDLSEISGSKIALRLRPFYNPSPVILGVGPAASANLPGQGEEIVSTGKVSGSEVVRKVRVFTSYKVVPAIFDYVLYSQKSLMKF